MRRPEGLKNDTGTFQIVEVANTLREIARVVRNLLNSRYIVLARAHEA